MRVDVESQVLRVGRVKDDYIEIGDFFSDAPDALTTPLLPEFTLSLQAFFA